MPPKARITKEMILHTVLTITRDDGFETVNARSIAGKLNCSTRPIFTCYENMDGLKKDFLDFAYRYFEGYVARYRATAAVAPALVHPLSYLAFARQEPRLFALLFVSDMDLAMTDAKDFYKEADNEARAAAFAQVVGLPPERAKVVFLDLFLYTHGIAVLTAAHKITLDPHQAETMVEKVLSAFLAQEKADA